VSPAPCAKLALPEQNPLTAATSSTGPRIS
jgi:hypothetical protein